MTDDVLSRLVLEGYLLQLNGWAGRHNYWAWTVFETLVADRPDVAWPMLLELVRRAPDEHLDSVAAGPLEDFIARHGARVIDVLEAEAAKNRRLRRTLAGVWQNVTPASVWARVEVLADRTGTLGPNVPDWPQNVIEVVIESPPPLRVGSTDEADVAARSLLLRSMVAAQRDDRATWESPVGLEIDLEPGVDGFPVDSTTIMRAVAETLSGDRPAGLVAPEWDGVALIASIRLIRELEVLERRGRTPGYRVRLRRMSEGQVDALNDVSTFEEMLESTDIEELQVELQEMRDRLERGDTTLFDPEP